MSYKTSLYIYSIQILFKGISEDHIFGFVFTLLIYLFRWLCEMTEHSCIFGVSLLYI